MSRAEAMAWCRNFTRSHTENFTVASRFLPKKHREHFYALYAFCRFTDDLGDEAERDRLALLDEWEAGFNDCVAGRYRHPVFAGLGPTMSEREVPQELFLRLVEANRMDQRVSRFPAYVDLLHYCDHSANPVGRMVLHVLGYSDEERGHLSDAVCTGLQLANFWQDVRPDWEKGRVYIPLEDLQRFGCSEEQIGRREFTPAFRELMRFEVERARALFREGAALEDMIEPKLRLDIRLFRRGGEAVLDAIEHGGYDVLNARQPVSRWRKARLLAAALWGLLWARW
jgi:squalene synthase HpnC